MPETTCTEAQPGSHADPGQPASAIDRQQPADPVDGPSAARRRLWGRILWYALLLFLIFLLHDLPEREFRYWRM